MFLGGYIFLYGLVGVLLIVVFGELGRLCVYNQIWNRGSCNGVDSCLVKYSYFDDNISNISSTIAIFLLFAMQDLSSVWVLVIFLFSFSNIKFVCTLFLPSCWHSWCNSVRPLTSYLENSVSPKIFHNTIAHIHNSTHHKPNKNLNKKLSSTNPSKYHVLVCLTSNGKERNMTRRYEMLNPKYMHNTPNKYNLILTYDKHDTFSTQKTNKIPSYRVAHPQIEVSSYKRILVWD